MKYMLLTYLDEKAWAARDEDDRQRTMDAAKPHVLDLPASRKFLGGAPLSPTSTAATVKLSGGKRLITDGPFAETREQLGGYTLIEASSQEEAVELASGFLGSCSPATIEVRRILEVPGVPSH